ncbi:MAG: thioredoxin family protein [Nanoarchaeota archaeon]
MSGRLLCFYGTECIHCKKMYPLMEKLEKELKIKITKLETWHNSQNATLLKKLDTIDCGGVPFFFNEKTKEAICGSMSYTKLKKWATK